MQDVVSTKPEIRAAAVVFRVDEHDRCALADFASELADSGCRLGGMVQESVFDEQGRRTRIDSVDLSTGDRVMINQPSRTWPDETQCTLGEQEESGAGLAYDILAVIAAGLAILVLVPEPALARWRDMTGGDIAEIPCEAGALRRWWHDMS